MTDHAIVRDATGHLASIPVALLTDDQRRQLEDVPGPRRRWPTFHGAAEDFSTERPMRLGY